MANSRATQAAARVLEASAPRARVTLAPILAIAREFFPGRATQIAVLVLEQSSPPQRVTQAAALAVTQEMRPGRTTQAAVLVVEQETRSARIDQAPVLALVDEVPCLTHWAECWKIVRRDGQTFAFTSLDRDLEFMGLTYRACYSLSASATELASVLGQIGGLELAGLISDSAITESDLAGGLFDDARVEIWMAPWQDAGGEIPFRLAAGRTGNLSHGDRGFTMEVLTPAARLQQQPLLETYTPGCGWDLGDSRCAIDLAAFKVTGEATSVAAVNARNAASRRIFRDTSRVEVDRWFDEGEILWTTGANAGARSEIKSYRVPGNEFTLWEPMIHPIATGDQYEVTPGCDKLPATCKAKFENYVNYGGFADVPGRDSITQTPNSK